MHSENHTRPTSHLRVPVAALALCAGGVLAAPVLADDYSWIAGSGSWGQPSNWTPFGLPGPADFARIGNVPGIADRTVFADREVTVRGLFISNSMGYQNEGWRTTVLGSTHIDADARIFLSDAVDGSDLITQRLTMTGVNARVILEDSMLRVHDTLEVGSGAYVSFRGGEIRITNPGVGLVNDGRIAVGPGASFFTHSESHGLIDLDGLGEEGRLHVSGTSSASIAVRAAALTDPFHGTIDLGKHARLHMLVDAGWECAPGSLIKALVGPDHERAEINALGRQFTLNGGVEVRTFDSLGVLRISQQTTVGPQASAQVFERAQLRFSEVELRGGTFTSHSTSLAHGGTFFDHNTDWSGTVTIDGAAQQNWAATVSSPLGATIDAGLLDMDGEDGQTRWTITGPLTVNAGSISRGAGDRFEGEMSIAGGFLAQLAVNLDDPAASWTMAGRMDLDGESIVVTRLSGSPVRVEGELAVQGGTAQITANVRVLNNAAIDIETGSTLRTRGRTNIGGATFAGGGTLHNGAGGILSLEAGANLGQIVLRNDAFVRVGEQHGSAGVVTVHRFQQGPSGELTLDMGGLAHGLEHDALVVNGSAVLAGSLTMTFFDTDGVAFEPGVGEVFTVLTAAGGIDGAFDGVGDTLHNGRRYEWELAYTPGAVEARVARVTTIGCTADIDGDGELTVFDQIAFMNAFEHGHPWADVDGDGTPTLFDFLAFLNAFDAGC